MQSNMGKDYYNNKFKKNSKKETRSRDKYIFCISLSNQLLDYKNISQYLISNIKKNYMRGNNISKALRNLTQPNTASWEPALVVLCILCYRL